MRSSPISIVKTNESVLATNRVLRNTYFLLSLTLLFSGLLATYSVISNAPPLGWIVQLVGMFGLLFLTMALRNSGWGLLAIFAFTGFMGYALGPNLNSVIHGFSNGPQLVAASVGGTGAIFLALSSYVLVTKKNFNFLGGILFVGLLAAIIAAIAAMVFKMPVFYVFIQGVIALIFSGFILYDTSRIVQGGQTNYIMATVSLYLDILNLFISLLNILSFFGGNSRN